MIEMTTTEWKKEAWDLLAKMMKAFDQMQRVSLPPNDCSGMQMWNEALLARKEVSSRLDFLVERELTAIREAIAR